MEELRRALSKTGRMSFTNDSNITYERMGAAFSDAEARKEVAWPFNGLSDVLDFMVK
jgi:hypothetical protein